MPHFVIDCSENIISLGSANEIMKKVFDTATSTHLFDHGILRLESTLLSIIILVIHQQISFTFLPISWKAGLRPKRQSFLKE